MLVNLGVCDGAAVRRSDGARGDLAAASSAFISTQLLLEPPFHLLLPASGHMPDEFLGYLVSVLVGSLGQFTPSR